MLWSVASKRFAESVSLSRERQITMSTNHLVTSILHTGTGTISKNTRKGNSSFWWTGFVSRVGRLDFLSEIIPMTGDGSSVANGLENSTNLPTKASLQTLHIGALMFSWSSSKSTFRIWSSMSYFQNELNRQPKIIRQYTCAKRNKYVDCSPISSSLVELVAILTLLKNKSFK